ncbi:Crp/Fnr family transcriptional regulator [Microvirga tunisiensis]|uniref:Crp/Fnr family transcriptional regulator n=2 Tax=Microvirga tunisiensis TaxID=2108360 RepID=A0A5N7MWD7_9HYPH|nr:Crp/Fnr family transcriptional regulator [Microvirga tunisiensis]MPR31267.1 Crp/Fnr family transcriptional regulator [Microvirga tunisiensis]
MASPGERRNLPEAQGPPKDHRANRLLAAMRPVDFALLEPHLKVVDLPRGAVVYEAGEIIRYTYFPHDAIVCLVEVMKDGRLVEVAMFGCEGVFGFLTALVSREALGRYMVLLPGTASQIAVERLQRAIRTRPHLRQLMLAYTEALLAQAFRTVACNTVHPVEARCCRWLLSTCDRVRQDTLPLTHEMLAEMLGVQRSTVSLVLRSLQTSGLIVQRRGGIVVTNRAGLEQAACECYGKIRSHFARLLPGTYGT